MSDLEEMREQRWSFVLQQIDIESALLPFEFADDCSIHRATEEQIQSIKEQLSFRAGGTGFANPTQYYEYEAVTNGDETRLVALPESKWRYYIVELSGTASASLHLASNISSAPLEVSALTFYYGRGFGYRSGVLQSHFEVFPVPAKKVEKDDLFDIAEVYRLINSLDQHEFPELQRALSMFDALSLLSKYSTFHVIGLFAIIEMLITHNPKLEDRGDSITHQMQSKIPLLSRRFKKRLDYSQFFRDATEKKVWAGLYKYRSAMAHGGVPDFNCGELKVLGDARNADNFLREVVKGLLRHALIEPDLYRDLRKC